MNTVEFFTIVGLVAGPILAVQIQKFIETGREAKNRKLWIFKTLMATRGAILSSSHVEALNRIDLEFSSKGKCGKVIEAWKSYFDNLLQTRDTPEKMAIVYDRREDLLADLLYEMGRALNYKFDKVLIKRNIYSPKGHWILEQENQLIRKKLVDLFNGEISFPISVAEVTLNPEANERQQKLQDLLIDYYTRENNKNNPQ